MTFPTPRTEASHQSVADKEFYKYPKISQIRLSSDPRNFDIFSRSNLNLDVTHLQYIFVQCVKFQNPRTKASYQNAADKLLHLKC